MKLKLSILSFLIAFSVKSQIDFTHNWSGSLETGDLNSLQSSIVDGSGNLYITGQMDGDMDFDIGVGTNSVTAGGKCYIAKYDVSGVLQWYHVLPGTGISHGSSVGVDGTGAVCVVGYFYLGDIDLDPGPGTQTYVASQTDMFIIKFSNTGVYQWGHAIAGVNTTYMEALNVHVNSSGDVVVCGEFEISTDFEPGAGNTTLTNMGSRDAFITKYNSSGTFQWAYSLGNTGNDFIYGFDVDASDNIYVTGQFEGTVDFDPAAVPFFTLNSIGAEDAFVAKYNSNGAFQWAGGVGGLVKDFGIGLKFANNEVIAIGAMQSLTVDADPGPGTYTLNKAGAGTNDTYLIKFNANNGALVWAKSTGCQGSGNIITRDINCDAANNIYLTGEYQNIVDFDLSAGSYTLDTYTTGAADIFLAKYDNSSNFIYTKHMGGGVGGCVGMSVNLYNYNVFIAGQYNDAIDIDPGPATVTLNFAGGTSLFLVKFTECNLPVMSNINGPGPICAGSSATISLNGTLNQAANWLWYSGSCGGPTVSTGATLVVSPTVTTAYFVRGVGGCAPGGMACFNSSVIVNPLTNISGQVTTNTLAPVPVTGSVTLYRFETQFTKFDSITTLPLDAGGNFTLASAPSMSYIVKAIPTASNLIITYAPSAISWKGATPFFHGCSGVTSQNVNVVALANFGVGPGMLTGKIVQGLKYGQKGAQVLVPGNPIKGISVKGGRNPGGNIGSQDMTGPSGSYTLGGLMMSGVNESYFILVDIPGLDTNNTYHKVIAVGTETFTQLDFVVDSAKIHPMIFVGVKEEKFENNSVKIFPNPTSGKLYLELELEKPSEVKIELLDIMGKVVETILPLSYQESKQTTIISNLKKHPAGIYFVNIETESSKKTSKIIISE